MLTSITASAGKPIFNISAVKDMSGAWIRTFEHCLEKIGITAADLTTDTKWHNGHVYFPMTRDNEDETHPDMATFIDAVVHAKAGLHAPDDLVEYPDKSSPVRRMASFGTIDPTPAPGLIAFPNLHCYQDPVTHDLVVGGYIEKDVSDPHAGWLYATVTMSMNELLAAKDVPSPVKKWLDRYTSTSHPYEIKSENIIPHPSMGNATLVILQRVPMRRRATQEN